MFYNIWKILKSNLCYLLKVKLYLEYYSLENVIIYMEIEKKKKKN